MDKKQTLYAPCSGEVIKLEEVNDEVFSSGILGKGFAIIPDSKDFYSPVKGRISNAHEAGHAYVIEAENGLEIMVHIGLDTVELEGEFFLPAVKGNMNVSKGDKLTYADVDKIKGRGFDPVVMVVVTNPEKMDSFKIKYGKVDKLESVMEYSVK